MLLADTDGYLKVLDDSGWIELPREPVPPRPASPLRFGPSEPDAGGAPFVQPGALVTDPFGRLWLLERGAGRIRLLAEDDLRLLDTVMTPAGSDVVHLAATHWGVVAADREGQCLWRQPYGGEWERIVVEPSDELSEYAPIAVAGGPGERAVAIFRPPENSAGLSRLAIVDRHRAYHKPIPGLEDPLPLILLPDGQVLIGEVEQAPEDQRRVIFTRFMLTEEQLIVVGHWAVRRFDGRALFLNIGGQPFATNTKGVRPLFPRQAALTTEGRVETFALDSGAYGCDWHRLFLDICLPVGTAVRVTARVADEPPPKYLRRLPSPPLGRSDSEDKPDGDWAARRPLGSRSWDDEEGWVLVEALDRRPARVDVPFPPERSARPSEDEYHRYRGAEPEPLQLETLEGLLNTPPGRYLWLRFFLRGTTRRSPALVAVRATYPRPSLLEHLPAFWRAEPQAAQRMDRALSLFEGLYTEIDQRIGALPRILDPRVCPPEAIEWLASFVALSFDSRVTEAVRRQLLGEITELYRLRGTPKGLERLCEILAQCEVKIVEAFRVRRQAGAVVAATNRTGPDVGRSVLGSDLQLGGHEGEFKDASGDRWEVDLLAQHRQLMRESQQQRCNGEEPCPAVDPPPPLAGIVRRWSSEPCPVTGVVPPPELIRDPVIAFYRRYAHRFSVLLFRNQEPNVEAVVQAAVEGFKPAHTEHELCWLDAGFRTGNNTYVGVGTRLAGTAQIRPMVLGRSPLGIASTLSLARPSESLGTFVRAAQVGTDTHLG